jgi:hypothetical protein
MSYYYTWRGAPMGPISIEELVDLAETEALPRETSVWQEGQAAWQPLPAAMRQLGHPLPDPVQLPPPDPPEGLAIHDFTQFPPRQPPPRTTPWPPPDHSPPPPSPVTWGIKAAPATAAPAPAPVKRARIPVPAKAQPPAQAPAPGAVPPPISVRGPVPNVAAITGKKEIAAPKPVLRNKPRKTATLRPPRARALTEFGVETTHAEESPEEELAPWAQEAAERASRGYTSPLGDTEEEENNTFAGPALNYGDIEPIIDRWNSPSGLRLVAPPPIPRTRIDFETGQIRIQDPVEEKEQEMGICSVSGESWPVSLMVKHKGKWVARQYLDQARDGDRYYLSHPTNPARQWARLILGALLIAVVVWIIWPLLHPNKNTEKKQEEEPSAIVESKTPAEPVLQTARVAAAQSLAGEPWAREAPEKWPPILMAQDIMLRGERRAARGSVFLVKVAGGQVAGLTALSLLKPPLGPAADITLDNLNGQLLTWKAAPRGPSDVTMSFTGRFGGLPTRTIYYPDVIVLNPEPLAATQRLPVVPLTPYPVAPPLNARALLLCAPENIPNVRQVALGGVIVEYQEGNETKFTILLDQPCFTGGIPGSPVLNQQGYLLGVITGHLDRPDSQNRARQFTGEPNGAYIRILERQFDRTGM